MAKYLIVGCTQSYGLLHGMYEAEVIEAIDQEEANEAACEYGATAVEEYIDYEEIKSQAEYDLELDPEDENYEDELDSMIEEIVNEEAEYWASKIKDEYQSMDIEELQKELHQVWGPEDFSKRYC